MKFMETQSSLKGVWRKRIDGCPHRHGFPEGPDRCDQQDMTVCVYELGNSHRCDTFIEIIEGWKEEMKFEVG